MELFGMDIVYLTGLGLIALLAVFGALIMIGLAAVILFWRTRRILIPGITLFVLDLLGTPIKHVLWLFGIEDDVVDSMIVDIRNRLYKNTYFKVPYNERVLFLPQCLRHPNCPAPLTSEGIQCKGCGRCGIFRIKHLAESLGYKVFIAPGSTLIRRMVRRSRPKAVLGVGCPMEVKDGTAKMASYGLPVQGVILSRDGCVDTRVDVLKLVERIKVGSKDYAIENDPDGLEMARRIAEPWEESVPGDLEIKKAHSKYKSPY